MNLLHLGTGLTNKTVTKAILQSISFENNTGIETLLYNFDQSLDSYILSPIMLYSNSYSDLFFKIQYKNNKHFGKNFSNIPKITQKLMSHMRTYCQVAFPVLSRDNGQDDQLRNIMETYGVPFVGSDSKVAKLMSNEIKSSKKIQTMAYPVMDVLIIGKTEAFLSKIHSWLIGRGDNPNNRRLMLKLIEYKTTKSIQIVKGAEEAAFTAAKLLSESKSSFVLLEPHVAANMAIKFSVTVIETQHGPEASVPLTIESRCNKLDLFDSVMELNSFEDLWSKGAGKINEELLQIKLKENLFDTKNLTSSKKSFNADDISAHNPIKIPLRIIQHIRKSAENIFTELGLRDYAKVQGWVLGPEAEDIVRPLNIVKRHNSSPSPSEKSSVSKMIAMPPRRISKNLTKAKWFLPAYIKERKIHIIPDYTSIERIVYIDTLSEITSSGLLKLTGKKKSIYKQLLIMFSGNSPITTSQNKVYCDDYLFFERKLNQLALVSLARKHDDLHKSTSQFNEDIEKNDRIYTKKFYTPYIHLFGIYEKLSGRFGDNAWKAKLAAADNSWERQLVWRSMATKRAQLAESCQKLETVYSKSLTACSDYFASTNSLTQNLSPSGLSAISLVVKETIIFSDVNVITILQPEFFNFQDLVSVNLKFSTIF
jgi:D-alanine-D-alanine ligase-like ATP-grasp enzyme